MSVFEGFYFVWLECDFVSGDGHSGYWETAREGTSREDKKTEEERRGEEKIKREEKEREPSPNREEC